MGATHVTVTIRNLKRLPAVRLKQLGEGVSECGT